jgi:rod shape-determining protein MreD
VRSLAIIAPGATVVLATLLGVLPWGLGSSMQQLLPALTLLVACFWAREHVRRLPASLLFASGLVVDALTGGPLGFWPLLYLTGLALAALIAWCAGPLRGLAGWSAVAVVVALTATLAWLVASAYFGELAEVRPVVLAGGIVIAAWPPVALVLGVIARGLTRPPRLNLERQG